MEWENAFLPGLELRILWPDANLRLLDPLSQPCALSVGNMSASARLSQCCWPGPYLTIPLHLHAQHPHPAPTEYQLSDFDHSQSTSSLNITTPAKLNPPAPHQTLHLAPPRLRGFPLCATHMLYLPKPSPGGFYPHRATLPLNPLFLVIPPMPHGQWKYHFPGEPSQPKVTLSLQPATAEGPMGLNDVFFRLCHVRFLLFAGRTP